MMCYALLLLLFTAVRVFRDRLRPRNSIDVCGKERRGKRDRTEHSGGTDFIPPSLCFNLIIYLDLIIDKHKMNFTLKHIIKAYDAAGIERLNETFQAAIKKAKVDGDAIEYRIDRTSYPFAKIDNIDFVRVHNELAINKSLEEVWLTLHRANKKYDRSAEYEEDHERVVVVPPNSDDYLEEKINAFHNAMRLPRDRVETLQQCFVDSEKMGGASPLFIACERGDFHAVKFLLEEHLPQELMNDNSAVHFFAKTVEQRVNEKYDEDRPGVVRYLSSIIFSFSYTSTNCF